MSDEVALKIETAMMGDRKILSCGCIVRGSSSRVRSEEGMDGTFRTVGCPRTDWLEVDEYVWACEKHQHFADSLPGEYADSMSWDKDGPFVERWRTDQGERITWEDWHNAWSR